MKKLIDAIFLLLPPIAGIVLISVLENPNYSYQTSVEAMIIGISLCCWGIPATLFYKKLTELIAFFHNRRHHYAYKEETEAESRMLNHAPVEKKYVPTKLFYQGTLVSGIVCYAASLIIFLVEIIMLRWG